MAVVFSTNAKNEALKGIRNYSAGGITTFNICAYVKLGYRFTSATVTEYNNSNDKVELSGPDNETATDIMRNLKTYDNSKYLELALHFSQGMVVRYNNGLGYSYWKLQVDTGIFADEIARTTTFVYNNPANGQMIIPNNLTMTIPAGNVVNVFKIVKNSGANQWDIVTEDIPKQVAPNGGVYNITTYTIKVEDKV